MLRAASDLLGEHFVSNLSVFCAGKDLAGSVTD